MAEIKTKLIRSLRIVSVVASLTILIFANSTLVFAASSTLGLRGYDAGNNSTSQIRSGQDNKWAVSFDNTSDSPASAQITNPIPTGSTLVPGSVQAPPGWTSSYSTDNGGTFSGVDAGSSTTNLKFDNSLVTAPGNGSGKVAEAPLSSAAQSGTGEDAYMPIAYKGRYFGIVHHSSQASHELVCATNIPNGCSGYPAALNLSGQTDFYTSINPLHYLDQSTGRLFFAAQRDVGYGIVCWDLNTDQLCANHEYTQLSATGAKLGADQPSGLLGLAKSGSCLYAWNNDLVMYSFDPANFSLTCGGYTSHDLHTAYSLPSYVPGQHNLGTSNYGQVASAQTIGTKIFFPVNYSFRADINFLCGVTSTNYCENTRLVCFDSATSDGKCSSWSTPSIGGANSSTMFVSTVFQEFDNNNPCIFFVDILSSTNATACYNANTGASATLTSNFNANLVTGMNSITVSPLMASYEEVTTTNSTGDLITIFPFTRFVTAANSGGAGCFDWTTHDQCAGWGSNGHGETLWATINGGDTRDYGYALDSTGCLLGLGDAGWIWSFSPDNGSVPCRRTNSSVSINPSASYCDGNGNVTSWDKLKITNLNVADFQEILVTVNDSNGNPVSGFNGTDVVPTNGILDLSSIPYSGITQNLTITVLFKALNNNPWAGNNAPIVSANFIGDDAQICYKTIAQDDCNVPAIVNTANSTITELSDSSVDSKSATKSLQLVTSTGRVCGATTVNAKDDAHPNAPNTGFGWKSLSKISVIAFVSLGLIALGIAVRRRFREKSYTL